MNRLAVALVVGSLSSACVTGRAQTPVQRPALDVPPPPPRVIEPLPSEPVVIEPVADLPPATSTTTRTRPQPQREVAAKEPVKPEPKPEPPPAEVTPPPAPTTSNPAPQIRAPGDNSETARQVRDILDRASKALSSINPQQLNRQRRENYVTAKQFIVQAEDAMKVANFSYALKLADKADTLAKELQGR